MELTQINPKVEFGVNPVHADSRLRAQLVSTCRLWRVRVFETARDPVRKLFSR
jgi:hypothetical protein